MGATGRASQTTSPEVRLVCSVTNGRAFTAYRDPAADLRVGSLVNSDLLITAKTQQIRSCSAVPTDGVELRKQRIVRTPARRGCVQGGGGQSSKPHFPTTPHYALAACVVVM
jgi:hypothetical protein